MNKSKINLIFAFIYTVLPGVAWAQNLSSYTFGGLIIELIIVLNSLVPILIAFALIFFFWGLSKFILNADNQINIQKGKDYMLWGVLALFILFSFSAIINFMSGELDLGGDSGLIPFLRTDANYTSTDGRLVLPE